MIRGITVQRANVAPSICQPVQWSEISQLAINNGSSLTVLDPILPTIHQSVVKTAQNSSTILDAKSLFNINTEIHATDFLQNLPRKILDAEILSYDETLSFGKFSDPIIVAHKWTPMNIHTRNTFLAVLLNTSELVILERETIAQVYKVKYDVNEFLIQSMDSPQTHLNDKGDLKLTNEQFQALKIVSFCFTEFSSTVILAIALNNGDIKVFKLGESLDKLGTYNLQNKIGLKLSWSPNNENLIVISNSNEIVSLKISLNDSECIFEDEKLIKSNSRFLISQVEWNENTLFVVDSVNLHVFNTLTMNLESIRLEHNALATGIIIKSLDKSTIVYIAFETGQSHQYTIDKLNEKLHNDSNKTELDTIVSRVLCKYQIENSASTQGDESNSNFGYLNDVVEGKYYSYGVSLNTNVIAMVSRVVPKRAINYIIPSKTEFYIDLIPVSTLNKSFQYAKPLKSTSVGSVFQYWVNNFMQIPIIPGQLEITNEFVNGLKNFIQTFRYEKPIFQQESSLELNIFKNLLQNEQMNNLQIHFNINTSILNTLNLLILSKVDDKSTKYLNELITELKKEQETIENYIFHQIGSVVFDYKEACNEKDNFVQLSYYNLMDFANENEKISDVKRAEIEIDSIGVQEQFIIEKGSDINREYVESKSNHKWKRCKLSLLPILQISNRTNESENFEYISKKGFTDYKLISTLLEHIDYCIYTGNRNFLRR